MKRNLFLLFAVLFMVQLQAQSIKLVEGDVSFLKGQDKIGVVFTYDENMKVGSGTEVAYMEKKMAEADKKEAGAGEKWKASWYEDRTTHFQPKFIELFEHYAAKKNVVLLENDENTEYTMIVNTTFIEPGFNVGMASKKASVNLMISIVETANPSNVKVKYKILKSPGTAYYDLGVRVGECYAKAGKEFAKLLMKKKAF
jgi:hypothetical protein